MEGREMGYAELFVIASHASNYWAKVDKSDTERLKLIKIQYFFSKRNYIAKKVCFFAQGTLTFIIIYQKM